MNTASQQEVKFSFVKMGDDSFQRFSDPPENTFLDAQIFHEVSCDGAMRTRYLRTWLGAQILEVRVLEENDVTK
jgi:hypothetical protein